MQSVGPVKIIGPEVNDEVMVPLATYEQPLWPSTHRGARVTAVSGGIHGVVIDDRMTRSVLLEASDASEALRLVSELKRKKDEMENVVGRHSRFTHLLDFHAQFVGNLLYLRFEFKTGDAAGHNMVTAAADQLITWIQQAYPEVKYISISGNYCTDKKASAVNGILGRGKNVIAEVTIPQKWVARYLKSTPERIVELHIKKNLIGTMLAGGIRTANAHFANVLLAFYVATGQDGANIVEGSQGFVHAEIRDVDLYFSVTIPNIIVGTVGNGKEIPFVQDNLKTLGCFEKREPGQNARRLAVIAAASVLCGELSLLAAQTHQGELMAAHVKMERS